MFFQKKILLIITVLLFSVQGLFAQTLSSPNPAVPAATVCKGATKVPIYEFSLAGTSPVTGVSFSTFGSSATILSGDVIQYQLFKGTTVSGASLIATSTSPSTSMSFTLFSTTPAPTGTIYWITADFSATATSGHSITVLAMTTGDITSSTGYTAGGNTFDGGTQTIADLPTVGGITATPSPLCAGSTLTLNATGTPSGPGSLVSYNWSGPALSSATTTTNALNYTVPVAGSGIYSLSVTYPGQGCTSDTVVSNSVIVNDTPTLSISIPSQSLCNGGSTAAINFTGTSTTNNWAYSAPDIGLGMLAGSGSIPSFTVVNTSSVSVTAVFTITPTLGSCSGTTRNFSITVNPIPFSSIGITTSSADNSMCTGPGGSLTLNANADPGTTQWSWAGSDGSASSSPSPVVSPTATTTYSVTLSSSAPGCNAIPNLYTIVATVNPSVSATAASDFLTVCNGGSITLSASEGINVSTYSWNTPAPTATIVPTSTLTTNPPIIGLNVYTLTVTNNTNDPGCVQSYTIGITAVVTPTASVSYNPAICTGGTSTLTATTGETGLLTFNWDGDASLSATAGAIVTASPSAPGIYIYTLTAVNTVHIGDPGCATPYSYSVTVAPDPLVNFSTTGDMCLGGIVSFTAIPTNGATTYLWHGPSITTSTTTQFITAHPPATGINTYSVTVSDGTLHSGCTLTYDTIVLVGFTPAAAVANSGPICVGQETATLIATSTTATSYTWTGPGGFSSTLQDPAVNPTTIGANIYSLTVTNNTPYESGCTPITVFTTAVTVFNLAALHMVSSYSGPYYCAGNPITYGVTILPHPLPGTLGTTCNVHWQWNAANVSFSDGGFYEDTTLSVKWSLSAPVQDTIRIEYIDENGCVSNDSIPTNIYSLPGVTISLTPPGAVCSLAPLVLSASSSGASPLTYIWSHHNISTSIDTFSSTLPIVDTVAPYVLSPTTEYYYVALRDNYNCYSFDTAQILVNPFPTVTGITSTSPVCNAATLSITATEAGGSVPYTYHWFGPTGALSPSTSTAEVVVTYPSYIGTYSVNVTDGNGCTSHSDPLHDTAFVRVTETPGIGGINVTRSICSFANDLITITGTNGADSFFTTQTNTGVTHIGGPWTSSSILIDSATNSSNTVPNTINFTVTPHTKLTTTQAVCTGVDSLFSVVVNPVTLTQTVTPTLPSYGGKQICHSTQYVNYSAFDNPGYPLAIEDNTVDSFQWTAAGGSVVYDEIRNHSLINFPAAGSGGIVSVTSFVKGYPQCPLTFSTTYTFSGTGEANPEFPVYITGDGNYLVCNDTAGFYQWGYDDPITLNPDTSLPNPTHYQSYSLSSSQPVSAVFYWVMIADPEGCLQKAYVTGYQPAAVSTVNAQDNSIKLYPNPAHDELNVSLAGGAYTEATFDIYDMMGRKLSSTPILSNNFSVSVSGLAPGCYLGTCVAAGKKTSTTRFIKK